MRRWIVTSIVLATFASRASAAPQATFRTSTTLVVQTMLGTATQLRDTGIHPVQLRESVTSPGGTTIAAIRELEQAGVRAALLNAVQAAMTRAQELASAHE